MIRLHCKA
jgi:mannose-6-phosphate isomerase